MKPRLLWVGDAACDSGFAKCTHETLPAFMDKYDVAVLGLNYRGDPHLWPYDICPAFVPGGDMFGVRRLKDMIVRYRPEVIVFQNDPWNIPAYVNRLKDLYEGHEAKMPFLVGAIAVDGKNCRGKDLNGLDHVVFWTKFADDEARAGGYAGTSSIVPLGVDLGQYYPGDQMKAREALGLTGTKIKHLDTGFYVLNVNRNQPRKRLDLTVEYFAAAWNALNRPEDLFLYLHVCPTGDQGYDIDQLAAYYGLHQRVILVEPGVYNGSTDDEMRLTYQASSVQVSTTQGEGWGLTTMEGMACGLPQIVPMWSALAEWANPAAKLIPCTTHSVTPNRVNVIGGIADKAHFVEALQTAYLSSSWRASRRARGLELVQQDKYRWENIAREFFKSVEAARTGAE